VLTADQLFGRADAIISRKAFHARKIV